MPSNTTGPVKLPETTISNATDAPLLYPTTTWALTRCASSVVTRAALVSGPDADEFVVEARLPWPA